MELIDDMDTAPPTSAQSFFTVHIDDAEIERILSRIDENLALRTILPHRELASDGSTPSDAPPPPDFYALQEQLEQLHRLNAPLFASAGLSLGSLARKAMNLPLQIFGRKQLAFNRQFLQLFNDLLTQLQHVREYAVYQIQLARKLDQLNHSIRDPQFTQYSSTNSPENDTDIFEDIRQLKRHVNEQLRQIQRLTYEQNLLTTNLEFVTQQQQRQQQSVQEIDTIVQSMKFTIRSVDQTHPGMPDQHEYSAAEVPMPSDDTQASEDRLTNITADLRRIYDWLQLVAQDQRNTVEWLSLTDQKLRMLALDVRERIGDGLRQGDEFPEPRIINQERFNAYVANSINRIRINLGCGEKPLPDYINIDFREAPGADVVADVRRLPFEHGTVAEIASFHLIEHFREHQLRTIILPYWKSLLTPDGILRIVCPNWAAMIERFNDGRLALQDFKLLTFGGQDYQGDDHFSMFTPETLSDMLRSTGFEHITVVVTERMNGLCPEMEVIAAQMLPTDS
jgi:predicted SAM-dependent methyltransferase